MTTRLLLFVALLFLGVASARQLRRFPRAHPAMPLDAFNDPNRPSILNCTEHFFDQKLDHFGYENETATQKMSGIGYTFKQRYWECLSDNWTPNGTIFYYTGNECNVDLFVNMTGLMWENAHKFGAVLIFAEHRFFGKSLPYPNDEMPHLSKLKHLTTDQALADYAVHIEWLRVSRNSPQSAVIGFGGSYGGMLCSWLRIKYPQALDGCIAGSAPIVNFEHVFPKYNPDAFAQVETFDATVEGGSVPHCADNLRKSWKDIVDLAMENKTQDLTRIFHTCKPIRNVDDAKALRDYIASAWPNMAMSSYPYPSSYLLLGGRGVLPAYPIRVSCSRIGTANYSSREDRLAALFDASLVYYNATSDFTCLNLAGDVNHATEVVDYLWNALSCSTMFMPSSQNGVQDMFWPEPWNAEEAKQSCQSTYGFTPISDWVQIQYGGWGVASWGSNIVFSNGGLDPWRPGGITWSKTEKVKTVIIPDMGHHIDLFFSNPKDTPAIKAARAMEVEHIAMWIKEKNAF